MLSRRLAVFGLVLIALGAGGYAVWRSKDSPTLVGVVRTTEIRVAPEVGGELATINVQKGSRVRAGDVVAKLSAIELSAAVAQARAALDAASAQRDHVYAGVRAEEVAALESAIDKAKSHLDYAQSELARKAQLVPESAASQQELDQAEHDAATARADVAEAQANYAAAVAGPTREERAIANAQVKAAATALAVLERRLDKTTLRAQADGIVSVIVAEVGENVSAGQPVLAIAATDKQWLSFNAREDMLHGLTVGDKVEVARAGGEPRPAMVTELTPLGPFATWQAERAIGDHDRNTLRLRLDPEGDLEGFEPGMTVWLER
ncbi:MAG: HlyD family efflux transporter periplasmic adaptor subunit [Xanthobacteraceae bacterium]